MKFLRMIMKSLYQPTIIKKVKGKVGEAKVDRKLNRVSPDKLEHKTINNLVILDNHGKTHQIDHVEIRENGIFCIETKNFTGIVYGNENDEKWIQVLSNGKKHQYYNPVKQNNSHVYHLSVSLGRKYKINSIVVMVNNNADKIECSNVVNLKDLQTYLNNFYDGTNYSNEQIDEIYEKIIGVHHKISNKEHVENIKKRYKDIDKKMCPRCGGNLVERNGRYGKFYGCSNYPNCKFTLKNK